MTASAQPVVRVRSPQAERLEAALRSSGAAVNRLNDALAVRGPSAAQVGDLAHAHGVALHELVTEQPSLEELFLQIAGTRREQ
jgi:ABC-2 type transport system ATP-binding protein